MSIGDSTIAGVAIAGSNTGPIWYSIVATATLSMTPSNAAEDILVRTEKNILVFAAEIEPWVLTR